MRANRKEQPATYEKYSKSIIRLNVSYDAESDKFLDHGSIDFRIACKLLFGDAQMVPLVWSIWICVKTQVTEQFFRCNLCGLNNAAHPCEGFLVRKMHVDTRGGILRFIQTLNKSLNNAFA